MLCCSGWESSYLNNSLRDLGSGLQRGGCCPPEGWALYSNGVTCCVVVGWIAFIQMAPYGIGRVGFKREGCCTVMTWHVVL